MKKNKLKEEVEELENILKGNGGGGLYATMALNGEISKPALIYFIEREKLFNDRPAIMWASKAAFAAITEKHIKKQVLIAKISAGIAFISALISLLSTLHNI